MSGVFFGHIFIEHHRQPGGGARVYRENAREPVPATCYLPSLGPRAHFADERWRAFDVLHTTAPHRMNALSNLGATTGGRVAIRLRPQHTEGSSSGSGSGSGSTSGASDDGEEDCLATPTPAFRFERQGLAIDEYHTHGDAPYEEELAKRVEAALSLSRPEDASELL